MRVGVVGLGRVGLLTTGLMARLGHRVAATRSARPQTCPPPTEPALDELVRGGGLRLVPDLAEATREAELLFFCEAPRRRPGGTPDLSNLEEAAAAAARASTRLEVVAVRSSVPVGTGGRLAGALALHRRAHGLGRVPEVVSNPALLIPGPAADDGLLPDRVVVGADSRLAHDVMRAVYAPLRAHHDVPYVATGVTTAELADHAGNAFAATKVSFINAVARLCELVGADARTVADAMGHDPRIGPHLLRAGPGYSGASRPADLDDLVRAAGALGYDFGLLREAQQVNGEARAWPLRQLRRLLWHLAGKDVAVLGAAHGDAGALVEGLQADGARIRVHHPDDTGGLARRFPGATVCDKAETAVRDAHAVVACVAAPEYAEIGPRRLVELLRLPVAVDACGVWDAESCADAGLAVAAVGRTPLGTRADR